MKFNPAMIPNTVADFSAHVKDAEDKGIYATRARIMIEIKQGASLESAAAVADTSVDTVRKTVATYLFEGGMDALFNIHQGSDKKTRARLNEDNLPKIVDFITDTVPTVDELVAFVNSVVDTEYSSQQGVLNALRAAGVNVKSKSVYYIDVESVEDEAPVQDNVEDDSDVDAEAAE